MVKIIYGVTLMMLSFSNCSSKQSLRQFNCDVVNNIIQYLKENEKEIMGNNIAVFNTTDALSFSYFRQEIQLHYPNVTLPIIDSLDHKATSQRIDCDNKSNNPKIELVFSNPYKNLVLCEWFYIDKSRNSNDINAMRRFKEAKNYLFELGEEGNIRRAFTKTIQYE